MKKTYHNRKTIGFFVSRLDYEYQREVWRGICDEAVKQDINVICFPGEIIQSRYGFEYQANIVYKIAGKENLDGIIILTSTIGQSISEMEIIDFFHSYDPLPVVSIGIKFSNIPSIIVDNKSGFVELITHLISKHACRRFAFISGPRGHQEAEQRLDTFQMVIEESTEHLDSAVYLQGDFRQNSGFDAVSTLLDELKHPVDAVVAANDSMAIGALEAFQARGIRVPRDVIVTGYDNIMESRNYTPPLTTVNQPVYKIGQAAIQVITQILNNENPPLTMVLPTHLVIRHSCGCFSYPLEHITLHNNLGHNTPFFPGFMQGKKEIIDQCLKQIINSTSPRIIETIKPDQLSRILNTFYMDIKNGSPHNLIILLNTILQESVINDIDVTFWYEICGVIRHYAVGFDLDTELLKRVENTCEKVRILIGETARRYQAFKRIQLTKWTDRLREVGNSLISTFDIDNLVGAILSAIIELRISQCYISIYEPYSDYPEKARLFLAYKNGKRIDIKENEKIYPTKEILPWEIFNREKCMSMVLEPLYFQNEQIGFLFCEFVPDEPIVFDILRQQISSALKGSLLLEEIKQYADNLEKEVARRTIDLTKSNKQLEEEITLRKKVEESLKEGERNLRAITEATPIPLVIARMSDGSILYANMPFCMSFGINTKKQSSNQTAFTTSNDTATQNLYTHYNYINEDIRGKWLPFENDTAWNSKLQDFFYDERYIRELLERLKKEDHLSNIELAAHRRDGNSFWVISSFQKMTFKGEECILSGFYDLTERRKLEREVLEAIGNERRRIGQDLHDDICQNMAGMAAIASVIENQLLKLNPQKAEKASYLRGLIKNTIIKTKALAKGLYPTGLEYNGLDTMFEELSHSINIQFNIPCTINFHSDMEINDDLLALQLYRITQEAVLNAVRHGHPEHIEINFNTTSDKMELIIKDDGVGIGSNSGNFTGMGIQNMKYRANMISGKLDIRQNGEKGTIVTCIIPTKNYRM